MALTKRIRDMGEKILGFLLLIFSFTLLRLLIFGVLQYTIYMYCRTCIIYKYIYIHTLGLYTQKIFVDKGIRSKYLDTTF